MKHKERLLGLAFGFAAAWAGMGCIVSGMRFYTVSMGWIVVCCLLGAAMGAFGAGRKWLPAVPVVFGLAVLRLWRKGHLNLSMEAFLAHISHLYDLGYGWGVLRWSEEYLRADMALLVICLLGMAVAFSVAWSFLRCKGTAVPLALTCLPVAPTMLLTDTIPSSVYVFGSLLCVSLLLMVRLLKKQGKTMEALKLMAIPVAAAMLFLFLCLPQEEYTGLKSVNQFFSWAQGLFTDTGEEGIESPQREEGDWVNLNTVGPKIQRRGIVMDVTASDTDYMYLKGAAFDTYYGTWWDCRMTDKPVATAPSNRIRAVKVTTRAMHDVLYLPYGAFGIGYSNNPVSIKEKKGQVENEGPWRSYNIKYRVLPEETGMWQFPSQDANESYTQLPDSTRQAAEDYLRRELPELQQSQAVWSNAKQIAKHVSESAMYSLNTPKMPAGTKDFALWFLEESETGYCVHFATAATVLLRAAGIPCRYVTGYLVYTKSHQPVEVAQSNAHAWVEVYIDGVGWVPLEPTPAGGVEQTAAPETTAPTETTTPPEETTTAPTEDTIQSTEDTTGPTEDTTSPTQTAPPSATEPIETPGDTTPPPETTKDDSPPERLPEWVPNRPKPVEKEPDFGWMRWLACVPLAVAVVLMQWRIRVALRLRKRSKGRKNAQALARWREIELHCRVRERKPEAELLAIAQRARFSHHAVTREELQLMDNWLTNSRNIITNVHTWRQRLLATVVFALY